MQLQLQSIQLQDEGILIRGPQGDVYLSKPAKQIQASYRGTELVNGSAKHYAEKLKQAAIDYAQRIPLPWSYNQSGEIRIDDHRLFYQQTFSAQIAPVEVLRCWINHLDQSI